MSKHDSIMARGFSYKGARKRGPRPLPDYIIQDQKEHTAKLAASPHLLDLNAPLAQGNPAPDLTPVLIPREVPWTTAAKLLTRGKYLMTVNLDNPGESNKERFRFVHTSERVDVEKERNFVTVGHEELEAMVGHPLLLGHEGKPVLSDNDCEVIGAALAIRHAIQSNPNLTTKEKQRIVRGLQAEARNRGLNIDGQRVVRAEAARLDRSIAESERQDAMLGELGDWLTKPFVLQKPDGSAFGKFEEAAKAGEVLFALRRPGENDDKTLPRDLATTLGPLNSFVVEHDWAGVISKAEVIGAGADEIQMPYAVSCFEFVISGKRVLAVFIEDAERVEPLRLVTIVRFNAGWGILMSYRVSDTWRAEPHVPGLEPAIQAAAQPLVDMICRNVKAIGILLETKIVEREVVRIDAKLNRAREKRGKLPLHDYHVVALARRERAKPLPPGELDPDRDITRKRWHLVRAHWRQYANHRTRVPWHSRGDIELGVVDKEYKL